MVYSVIFHCIELGGKTLDDIGVRGSHVMLLGRVVHHIIQLSVLVVAKFNIHVLIVSRAIARFDVFPFFGENR